MLWRRALVLLLWLGLIAAMGAPRVRAANVYYVAPNGSDTNAGTLAAPWRTIQRAADTLAPGETVYVRGGEYHERVRIHNSGTRGGGWITFAAYPNESPIVDGRGVPVPADWGGLVQLLDVSYIRVQGFEIRNLKTPYQSRKTAPKTTKSVIATQIVIRKPVIMVPIAEF